MIFSLFFSRIVYYLSKSLEFNIDNVKINDGINDLLFICVKDKGFYKDSYNLGRN